MSSIRHTSVAANCPRCSISFYGEGPYNILLSLPRTHRLELYICMWQRVDYTYGCAANPYSQNQNRPNPTQFAKVGRFLEIGGFGWIVKIYFFGGLGWVRVNKITNQPNLTRPTYI